MLQVRRSAIRTLTGSHMLKPGAYQGGFTETSRCTDQGKLVVNTVVEPLHQPRTFDQIVR